MKAKYAGDCDRCDDPIRRGENIVIKTVFGMPTMLHPRCASGQDDDVRPVKAVQTKMFVSGFCNPNNPPDSHERCKVAAGELTCTCECHTVVAGEESEAPIRVGSPKVEPTIPDGHAASPAPGPRPPLPDNLHGFYDDIPEPDYHAHGASLSVSGAKTILKAPALYQWQRTHPVYKNVFDFGSAAHKMVLGVGAELTVHEYDRTKVKSPKSTNAWKDQQRAVRAAGGVLLLPDEYQAVCDMANELAKNTLAMELLSQGKPEVSAFATDKNTGVLRRARFDWLADTILSDYKSAVNADPNGFDRVAFNFGYYMQAPWYVDLAAELGHPAQAFAFIVQEKEPPYLVSVCELDRDAMQLGRERNRQALEIFRDCTASGIWPGYQTDGCFSTISLPRYAFYEGNTQ